jgi:hypothetical protein
MGQCPRRGAAYGVMLLAQTGAASFLFWTSFPLFQALMTHPGEPQNIDLWVEVGLVGAVILQQCCYWSRFTWIPIRVPFKSAVAGHLLLLASRVSFFFASVLFSTIFFRHIPQLERFPPFCELIVKSLTIFAILFAVFCYSQELEKLGKAMEE